MRGGSSGSWVLSWVPRRTPMLRRLGFTLIRDMVVQYRNGFYLVSGFVVAFMAGLYRAMASNWEVDLVLWAPMVLTTSMIITTFFFIAALVLLEKDEGTLAGSLVTPLRPGEYLASKGASLALLATLEASLIILLAGITPHSLILVVPALLLLGCSYSFLGFASIVTYDSINAFLLPSIGIVLVLMLPLMDHFGLWRNPIFYLHPLQPALVLMGSAFDPLATGGQVAYGLLGCVFWALVSYGWARHQFQVLYQHASAGAP